MKHTSISRALLPLLAALSLASCFDDKGNYDYVNLPDFYIDTTGTVARIPVHAQFDTLRLSPGLVSDSDRSDLSFAWTIYSRTPGLTGNPATTLATTEHLAAPVSVFPGDYWIEFRATDTRSGRVVSRRFTVTIESSGSGLLVLYERDGLVDCDMIKTRLLTGNIARDEVKRRMYSSANPDRPLSGEPVAIEMFNYQTERFISIYTSDDGLHLSPDDMSITKNFRDLFLFAPRVARPRGYRAPYGVISATPGEASDGVEILVSDGTCYLNMVLLALMLRGQPIFSERTSTVGDYHAAPFPFYGFGQVVVYDELGRRFLSGGPLATTLGTVVGAGDKFNLGNIGKDLVYLDYGFNGQYMIYAIFKNPVDDGSRYLYVMDFYSPIRAVAAWDISAYDGIASASHFAFGRRGPVAFYAAGNKVYRVPFDLNADSVGDSPVEAWAALPPDEIITCLELCAYPGRDVSENTRDRYLFVGSYNESTREGKLHVIQVNVTSGACTPTPVAVFEQFGKIKDVSFKF